MFSQKEKEKASFKLGRLYHIWYDWGLGPYMNR